MSGRNSVDDSVIERRLRPIYDWLDNGNNRKAVQEADKVLKKQPKLHCAKVLKGLALLRLGRSSECTELIDNVVADGTSDEATLQALTICFREMHQPEKVCSVYEIAAKLDPNNEEIISHLFMAYVRIGDYRKQQVTALQLYKLKPKNPYYFWAVMSIVMQSQNTNEELSKKVKLEVAERMITKFVKEEKIDAEAEIMTYLYILEMQKKYKDALAVLEGPLVQKIVHQPQNFLAMKKAMYQSHLKNYEASSVMYMNLIRHELDNWQHYVNFTETVLLLYEKLQENSGDQTDPLVEASNFLLEIREMCLNHETQARSPLLGLLQFALALIERRQEDKVESLCGNVTEQFVKYIDIYGDKMCCYGDIVKFIPLIPQDRRENIMQEVKSFVKFDDNSLPVDIKNIYRHQFNFQLTKAFGLQEKYELDDHLELADLLVGFYTNTTHLWTDMAITDIRPNDCYMVMAAHSYFSALPTLLSRVREGQAEASSYINRLLKLCCLLEHGIDESNANFQMKLLLLKAYNMIGATGVSYSVYDKLDLKHIQMDTLAHVLSLQALDTGKHIFASKIFSNTLKFFMANHKDTSDPLILSYKFGSLVKIPEFVEFRNRLKNSANFHIATAEQRLLDLATKVECTADLSEVINDMEIDLSKEKIDWDNLRDNRDLHVMNSWEPQEKKLSGDMVQESFDGEVAMLRIRSTMFKVLYDSYHLRKRANLNKSLTNGDSNGICDSNGHLNDSLEQLRQATAICDKYSKLEFSQVPLQGPDTPRIYIYSQGQYTQCFLQHAEILQFINSCTLGSENLDNYPKKLLQESLTSMLSLLKCHECYLETFDESLSKMSTNLNRDPLVRLWHLIQTIGLVLILIECSCSVLNAMKSNIQKRNKKKKINSALPEVFSNVNNNLISLGGELKGFDGLMSDKVNSCKNILASNAKLKYTNINIDFPIKNKTIDPTEIFEKIDESFTSSLCCLQMTLKAHIRMLSLLKV